jgi:hypothetical protein
MKNKTKLFAIVLTGLIAFAAVQRNAVACDKNKKSKTNIQTKMNKEDKNQVASTKADALANGATGTVK